MNLQEHYAKYVSSGGDGPTVLKDRAAELGYDDALVPPALQETSLFQASCGSGCPIRLLPGGAISAKDAIEIVMDLGCGAGHDVLLAANQVQSLHQDNHKNDATRVIGVDLTHEMIAAAQKNLQQYPNLAPITEFIHADFAAPDTPLLSRFHDQVDLVISNGVFNLCPDKLQAFQNVFELLKPGGRLVFSDVMQLPPTEANPNAKIATSINGDVFSS